MACIQARTNQGMMVLDRLEDDLGGVPAMQPSSGLWSMRMNADGDFVLVAELVQAVEAVWIGVRAEHLNSQRFAELERLAIGVCVFGEVLHSPGARRDLILFAQFQQGGDLCRRAVDRGVLLKQLHIM